MSSIFTQSILNLSPAESFDFLMQAQQYCDSELPDYFDFQPMLDYCKTACKQMELPTMPNNLEGVNLELLMNKDGRYGVRPITIANPFLYTFLAQTICEPKAWEAIVQSFKAFKVDSIQAFSIPLVTGTSVKEAFYKSTTILNWWSHMEQLPIELSMQYRYMFISDITNCYGQITPRSIDWALSRKGTDLATDANHDLAGKIIKLIAAMQGGKQEGIPQGSVLYALVAEIVLGYADLLLDRAIKAAGITADYRVLRYVDDYRIFCNDRGALEQISYLLQHTLETLNFRMNTSKTKISDSIVSDAVKADKAFYIFNTPIYSKKGVDFDGFQKHLYFIYEYGRQFPNSGQMKVLLSDFSRRLQDHLNIASVNLWKEVNFGDEEKTTEPVVETPQLREKILPMVAILTQIATENVTAAHYALRIASILLDTIKQADEKTHIISLVYNRLRHLPNSSFLQLWLQNLTYATGIKAINSYDSPLCRVVESPKAELWNNSWLDPAIAAALPTATICDRTKLRDAGQIITIIERPLYTDLPDNIEIPEDL